MNLSTAGKNTRRLRITIAVAILASAGLSGCASDPYYDNPRYGQTYYQPSVYQSPRYYDSRSNAPSHYYDTYQPSQGYYYPNR